jgi:hypothetical protein
VFKDNIINMKKLVFIILIITIHSQLIAQRVIVEAATEKVKSSQVDGYQSKMDANKKELQDAWLKFAKNIGKSKSSGDVIEINDVVIDGEIYAGKTVYSKIIENERSTTIWMGIREKDWDENYTKVEPFMERLVKEFSVRFYQERIMAEIGESEKALRFAERQQSKTLNENNDLKMKLEENEREKLQLERSLNNNQLQNQVIKQKIENNTKTQDSLSVSLEKIKRMIEMQRERMRQIN